MKRSLRELMTDERTQAVDDGTCPSGYQGRCDEESDPAGAEEHRHIPEHAWMIALIAASGFLGRRLVRRRASREGGSTSREGDSRTSYRFRAERYPFRVRVRTPGWAVTRTMTRRYPPSFFGFFEV